MKRIDLGSGQSEVIDNVTSKQPDVSAGGEAGVRGCAIGTSRVVADLFATQVFF